MKKKLSTQTSKEEGNRSLLSKPPRRTYNRYSAAASQFNTLKEPLYFLFFFFSSSSNSPLSDLNSQSHYSGLISILFSSEYLAPLLISPHQQRPHTTQNT